MKKEELKSDTIVKFYKSVAKKCLNKMSPIEELLEGKNKSLKLHLRDKSFEVENNKMHYEGYVVKAFNGDYVTISADKEIGDKNVSIILERGLTGFDIGTGERYDRKLGRVAYTYDGEDIQFISLQDENDLRFNEEIVRAKIAEQVQSLKKKRKGDK